MVIFLIYYYTYNTIIGNISIYENNNYIIGIQMFHNYNTTLQYIFKNTLLIQKTYKQLNEYFEGLRHKFTIPIKLTGTIFQQRVWQELMKIPYGSTTTYKYIAEKIGNPKGYRAVGMACNKNPLLIIIPCHRIIGSNNNLTGFALGIDIKQKLLNLEKQKN